MTDDVERGKFERKAAALLQLKKTLDTRKKKWLLRQKRREVEEECKQQIVLTDSQKYAKEVPLVKGWHESLKKKYLCKQSADLKRKDEEVEIMNKLLKEQLQTRKMWEEKVKKIMKPQMSSTFVIPAVESFFPLNASQDDGQVIAATDAASLSLPLPPTSKTVQVQTAEDKPAETLFHIDESDEDSDLELLQFYHDIIPTQKDDDGRTASLLSASRLAELEQSLLLKLFSAKPSKILFKDYEFGKVYNKKVVLTNIHTTPLTLRVLGISERLAKIVQLRVVTKDDKVDKVLVGMSCKLIITFRPKQDLKCFVQSGSIVPHPTKIQVPPRLIPRRQPIF